VSAFDETTVLALSPIAQFQSLGQGAVILLTDSGQLYSCNETTESFLKAVNGVRTIGDIVDEALAEFEVDRDTLRADFVALAAELAAQGIVRTV
jgi:hypothetical protein